MDVTSRRTVPGEEVDVSQQVRDYREQDHERRTQHNGKLPEDSQHQNEQCEGIAPKELLPESDRPFDKTVSRFPTVLNRNKTPREPLPNDVRAYVEQYDCHYP